jgi:hypothetical protein
MITGESQFESFAVRGFLAIDIVKKFDNDSLPITPVIVPLYLPSC